MDVIGPVLCASSLSASQLFSDGADGLAVCGVVSRCGEGGPRAQVASAADAVPQGSLRAPGLRK